MVIFDHLPEPNSIHEHDEKREPTTRVIDTVLQSSYFHPKHSSPLGFLCTFNGSGNYLINQRYYTISGLYYFPLNANSQIEIEIPAQRGVNPFFILFDSTVAKSVNSVYQNSVLKLLDDPYFSSKSSSLVERLNHIDSSMQTLIDTIRYGSLNKMALQEAVFELYEKMISADHENYIEISKLKTTKWSTKQELYYRLYKAKHLMVECYAQNLTLEVIASHATLNSFHLLRLFKQLFGQTPRQYLESVRLEKAKELLLTSDQSISEILTGIGFESPASFSHLFKRKFGLSPKNFRGK